MQYARLARYRSVAHLQGGRLRAARGLLALQIANAYSYSGVIPQPDSGRHVSHAAAPQPFAVDLPCTSRLFLLHQRRSFATHVLRAMTVKESEYPELLSDFHELVNMDVRCLSYSYSKLQHRMIKRSQGGLTVCCPDSAGTRAGRVAPDTGITEHGHEAGRRG